MSNSTNQLYNRLADFLIENLNRNFSIILEAGCGQGHLTIPFTKNDF